MKLDINKLNEAVEKAFDKIFEEEDRKEVKNTKPTQWHDDYSNKEESNVVQTRINPSTKKPEFKIPTNNKVFDTRDAAIAALNRSKKKAVTINESDIRNMVMEALSNNMEVAYQRINIAIEELERYISVDKSRQYDLAVVMNHLRGVKKCLEQNALT